MENWRRYRKIIQNFPAEVLAAITHELPLNVRAQQLKVNKYLVLDMNLIDTGSMTPEDQIKLSKLTYDGIIVPCTGSAMTGWEVTDDFEVVNLSFDHPSNKDSDCARKHRGSDDAYVKWCKKNREECDDMQREWGK